MRGAAERKGEEVVNYWYVVPPLLGVLFLLVIALAMLEAKIGAAITQSKAHAEDRVAFLEERLVDAWKRIDDMGKLAAAERRELYARIQAWETTAQEVSEIAASAVSQPKEVHSDEPDGYTASDLAKMSIQPNSDGGFIDLMTKGVWDSIGEIQEYRAILRARGLPATTHPNDIT